MLPERQLHRPAKESQFLFGLPQHGYEFAAATNPGFFFGSPSIPPTELPTIPAADLPEPKPPATPNIPQTELPEQEPPAAPEEPLLHELAVRQPWDTLIARYGHDEMVLSMQSPYTEIPDNGTTSQDNTTVHIAVLYGHEGIARASSRSDPRLLAKENANKDTPLHLAAATGNASLVSSFIQTAVNFHQQQRRRYIVAKARGKLPVEVPAEAHNDEKSYMKELLLKVGRNGGTPLHEAMRHGHESTALLLVEAQPDASEVVDKLGYSVLYLAVLKGSWYMLWRLLEIESSSHAGPQGTTAMHAAVLLDNLGMAEELLSKRPVLCRNQHHSPLHNATFTNKLRMVKLIVKHDKSVVYDKDHSGNTPVHAAAMMGHLDILMEFLRQCPDSGLCLNNSHQSILVMAVLHQQSEVVEYVLRTANLSILINQPDISGNTPLHWAAFKCNPKLLRLLLADKRVDRLATNMHGQTALDIFYTKVEMNDTIEWNETLMILDEAVELGYPSEIRKQAKERIREKTKLHVNSTEKYVQNTTIVSALMATVMFVAAFTVPGGFTSDSGNADEGTPLLIHNLALKVFVVSDTIALIASTSVTFLCIDASWKDVNCLFRYRAWTRKLMRCAFCAMTVAFATGMYATLAPRLPWLAILVCTLCCILPPFMYVLANWPMLEMWFRMRKVFLKDHVIRNL